MNLSSVINVFISFSRELRLAIKGIPWEFQYKKVYYLKPLSKNTVSIKQKPFTFCKLYLGTSILKGLFILINYHHRCGS